MSTVLVTGASSFLGYHVVKRLNASGIRPRVLELPGSPTAILGRLDVETGPGYLGDAAATRQACAGIDTLLHMAFKVSVGGGALLEEMRRINVDGSRTLLQTAAGSGVRRAVVAGSALAVGVNRQAAPLSESASWSEHAFELPYAVIRREAELDARRQSRPGFDVVAVCPSFTFGPDDPTGVPANGLLERILAGKQWFSLRVGFGCLDVRDFAHGVLLAAERGGSGERYLLSGENVTADQLLERVSALAGTRVPRLHPPAFLLHGLVGALGAISRLRRKPPPATREVLQIIGRYAWYDTSKAARDLGWTPRPLDETLRDTIAWLRSPGGGGTASAAPVASAR
jgi:dihydroflavonol-4-reductase